MPSPETFHSSLRRCDLYDNPYNTQMQAHPSIVKRRQEVQASKDSISSSQSKLEKELFETFKQQGLQLFSGKFFIIAQAGKYAFLAIMLPTYLFFYGIPKWMLTEAAPNIYNFSKRIVTNAGSKLGSAVSHVASAAFAIVRTVTDPILNFIQTRIEQTREFYHQTKQKLERWVNLQIQRVLYPFRLINEKLLQPIKSGLEKILNPVQSMKEVMARILDKIRDANARFRQTLIDFPDKVADVLRSIPDKMKALLNKMAEPFSPVINVFKKIDGNISQFFENATAFSSRMMEKYISRPASACLDIYERSRDWTKEKLQQLTEPLLNWAQPKIEKLSNFASKIKERIGAITETISSKAKDLSDRISETVKDPAAIKQDLAQIIPQPVIAFFNPILTFTGTVAFAPFRLFKKRKQAGKYVVKLKEKIKTRIARVNQKFLSFLKNSYQRAKPKCIRFIKVSANGMIKAFQILKEMLKGAFYMLKMIFAWLKILIKHGMFLVRETCSSWLPTLKSTES